MKTNSELFDLLTNPEMFDSTVELLDAFKVFKEDIFENFWKKLFETLRDSESLSDWKIKSNIDDLTIDFSKMEDKDSVIYFQIYYKVTPKNYEFVYGVAIEDEFNRISNVKEIYEDAKKFKINGWKNANSPYMPIYYNLESIDFHTNSTIKKILPNYVDDTVKEIADTILEDFNSEVQSFIITNLKKNKII